MDKTTKEFLKTLTLQTSLQEIKNHCITEEDTNAIMSSIYNLMSTENGGTLSDELKFTFSGKKVEKEGKEKKIESLQKLLNDYYSATDEQQKNIILAQMSRIFNIDKSKHEHKIVLTDNEKAKAKQLFGDLPKDQLKTSLIQRKMLVGFAKAITLKEYLLTEK